MSEKSEAENYKIVAIIENVSRNGSAVSKNVTINTIFETKNKEEAEKLKWWAQRYINEDLGVRASINFFS